MRAQADQWMDWMQTTLAPDFYALFFESVRQKPEKRNPQIVTDSARRLRSHYAVVERQLDDKPFMLGDELSMADIVIGATLYRYYEMPIERPGLARDPRLVPAPERPAGLPHPCHGFLRGTARASAEASCRSPGTNEAVEAGR